MRNIVKLAFLGLVAVAAHAGENWLTNPVQAKEQAQRENKAVFVDFTGSDWCPPCKRLKANVLDTPVFQEFAKKKLVLLEVDSPRDKSKLTPEVHAENAKLKQRFRVNAYPTVVVLSKAGVELGRMSGYGGDSPEEYIQKLEGFLAKAGGPAGLPAKPAK